MKVKNAVLKALGPAVAVLLLAAPGWSATYHVYGGVYAAEPIPTDVPAPPSVLPSTLTADEIVGEESYYATGVLAMVRVDIVDDSAGTVLASSIGLLGPYYASFDVAPATTTVRFSLHDAATGDKLFETQPVSVAAGTNRRYLLAPISVLQVGGASLIPHPAGGAAYAFTRVGLVEAADIGGDGLADFASAAPRWRNAPFGRTLKVFGAASAGYYPWWGAGNFCYKVRATPPAGGAFYIDDPLYKREYRVDTSTTPPTVTSDLIKVGPFNEPGISGCYRFTPLTGFGGGGTTIFWSFPDLLANWNTVGHANGNHSLTLEVYRRSDGAPQPAAGAALNIHVDNRGVPLSFDKIEQRNAGGVTEVDLLSNPCDIVHLTGGRQLFIEYTAHHAGGFLASYSLRAVANSGASATLADDAYDPTTMLPAGFSGVNPGTVVATPADLAGSCAYTLRLHAWARTTNGYGRLFHPDRIKAYYIQVP